MKLLSLDEILILHALVLSRYGGSAGVRDIGRLEAVVACQTQVVFGVELYDSLFDKVAAMVRGLVADHPFVDGNKRTAMLVGLTLVESNGYVFTARKGELEDFAVSVATDHLDIPAIAEWIETHSRAAS